jgi:prevent-host-death family protein
LAVQVKFSDCSWIRDLEAINMSTPSWQLQDAKNNFSRLIKLASGGAAQVVTVHGKPAAVIVSAIEYEKLRQPRAGKLSRLLLKPGLAGDEFDITRDKDTGRELKL